MGKSHWNLARGGLFQEDTRRNYCSYVSAQEIYWTDFKKMCIQNTYNLVKLINKVQIINPIDLGDILTFWPAGVIPLVARRSRIKVHFVNYDPIFGQIDVWISIWFWVWLLSDCKEATEACPWFHGQIPEGHPPQLHHLVQIWSLLTPKNKIMTAFMPIASLQNGSPQTRLMTWLWFYTWFSSN